MVNFSRVKLLQRKWLTSCTLNVREKGKVARDEFIQKCIEDPSTFDKPIKRIKNCTFALEGIVKKKKGASGKIIYCCTNGMESYGVEYWQSR